MVGPQPPPDGTGESGDAPVPERLVSLLENPWRRDVVAHLRERGGRSTISALAPRLADARDVPLATVITTLYDRHLPRLAASGVLTYDRTTGDVELVADAELVGRALRETR